MIYLGLNNQEKDTRIADYCATHGIEKVVVLSPAKFSLTCSLANHEQIEYADIIEYKFFYRLVQEINQKTLVVVNECLRTQNRYDLTYNCIRHFLNQTRHQLVFQYLPLIDSLDDFMILFDFDTRSQWKREKWRAGLMTETQIEVAPINVTLNPIAVDTSNQLKAVYEKEKEKLIANIGLKDPHTIPRNLYLLSGKAKAASVSPDAHYIGRNNRFKIEKLQTYKEDAYGNVPYTVFEFCHNFIDFADFMALSRQSAFDVLAADLKIDHWYLTRYREWGERLKDAYTSLQRREKCAASGA